MQDYMFDVKKEMKIAEESLLKKPAKLKRKEIYLYGSINMTAIAIEAVKPVMPIFGV